jgi:hypothetical protein
MALKHRESLRMRQMKDMEHVVTHKSHFDQFMEIGNQSPGVGGDQEPLRLRLIRS